MLAARLGSISYNGSVGDLDYTFSLENNAKRGALGGNDYRVLSPTGALIERRDQVNWDSTDDAKLSAVLKYENKSGLQANLTLDYDPYWERGLNDQRRIRTDGDDNHWVSKDRTSGFQYDFNGDVSAPLGSGRLKLIGLRHFEHAPAFTVQRTDYDSGAPSDGLRYGQDARTGETVARLEYHWKGGPNDWTVSFERADNSYEQDSTLAELQPDGSYVTIPYPEGSGTVAETRYEGLVTLSRSLSSTVDLQAVAGAEYSELGERGIGEKPRRFFRPKGSVLLAWRPAPGWDASLKVERKVGQISFSDFLANEDITHNHGNAANPNLVPPQSWEVTGEVGRDFGRWGKTRLRLYHYRIEAIVDHIPVGIDGDAVGNLPRAARTGVESISTILFDPVGWHGAKLDADLGIERARVRDPLTGASRQISDTHDRWAQLTLRHDVPHQRRPRALSPRGLFRTPQYLLAGLPGAPAPDGRADLHADCEREVLKILGNGRFWPMMRWSARNWGSNGANAGDRHKPSGDFALTLPGKQIAFDLADLSMSIEGLLRQPRHDTKSIGQHIRRFSINDPTRLLRRAIDALDAQLPPAKAVPPPAASRYAARPRRSAGSMSSGSGRRV